MTGKGGICEMQGTAGGEPFSDEEFTSLLTLARMAIADLVEAQKKAVAG